MGVMYQQSIGVINRNVQPAGFVWNSVGEMNNLGEIITQLKNSRPYNEKTEATMHKLHDHIEGLETFAYSLGSGLGELRDHVATLESYACSLGKGLVALRVALDGINKGLKQKGADFDGIVGANGSLANLLVNYSAKSSNERSKRVRFNSENLGTRV